MNKTLTIQYAEKPVFITDDKKCVSLLVKFLELPDPVQFVATPNDPEQHGRFLYEQTIAGAYGPVAPFVTPQEVTSES